MFWRVFGAIVVALLVVAGVRAFFTDEPDEDEEFQEAESDDEALSVLDAINRNPQVPFAVRGWVYDDGAFLQLCHGFSTDGEPRCKGPVLLLQNLDVARLDLERGEWNGEEVRYTAEPVILGGTIDGTQMAVVEILSSAPD